jgi:hypothetical protein
MEPHVAPRACIPRSIGSIATTRRSCATARYSNVEERDRCLFECRPTLCRSAAASAAQHVPKYQRSCARSGQLQRRVGRLATHACLLPAYVYHTGTESRRHNGRLGEPPHARDHTWHNEQSAQRAIEPRQHNEHWHDEPGTTSVPESRPTSPSKKVCRPRCHSRPTGCRSAAASARHTITSKRTISRAKRSAGTACWAGRF